LPSGDFIQNESSLYEFNEFILAAGEALENLPNIKIGTALKNERAFFGREKFRKARGDSEFFANRKSLCHGENLRALKNSHHHRFTCPLCCSTIASDAI